MPFGVAEGPLRITCLGAHCDDIEIGAGATLLRLLDEHPGSSVTWVVPASDDRRATEARASSAAFCAAAASLEVSIGDLDENVFPFIGTEVRSFLVDATDPTACDLVFAPRGDDLHQDHRVIADLALQRFRDQPILRYEIAKYDGDLTSPNAYVGLEGHHVDRKIELLFEHFGSQVHRPWFDERAFRGLMRIRGVECNRTWAEGFHVAKFAI
jgi:LmbE family N-acetylglucosaminyl deacetylase